MSFVPVFAADALSQWRVLHFELQESVLDALEEVLADPPLKAEQIVDVVQRVGEETHYAVLHVSIEHDRSQVVVLGVGHHVRGKEFPSS